MDDILSWVDCEKFIVRVSVNESKVRSLINMACLRQDSLSNEPLIFKKIEQYYEIMKELLSALMLLDGLKSSNHECLVSYFKFCFKDMSYESVVLHELKKVRNMIQYEGFFPGKDYLSVNELEFKHIIDFLKVKILEKLGVS